jgi:DNA-binding transcriptional ArsR family regulator
MSERIHTGSKELHQLAVRLTLALYRVTDFFPQEEPLRQQLREKSTEILESVIEDQFFPAKIYSLLSFLEVAGSLNFVRPLNIVVLQREYETLLKLIPAKKVSETKAHSVIAERKKEKTDDSPETAGQDFNERQVTILEFLSERESAKISDLTEFFHEVSSKTIQRDLQDLVNKGILKKEGERRWTVYSVIKAVVI